MISELEEHEDMLSPWKRECDSDQCLSGLAVIMLAQIPRDWGSIQCIEVTDRCYITKIQDKCHLFICTTDIKSQFALKMGVSHIICVILHLNMILQVKPIELPFLKSTTLFYLTIKNSIYTISKTSMFALPDDTVNQCFVLTYLDSYLGLFDCKASAAANDFVCKCQYVSTAVS